MAPESAFVGVPLGDGTPPVPSRRHRNVLGWLLVLVGVATTAIFCRNVISNTLSGIQDDKAPGYAIPLFGERLEPEIHSQVPTIIMFYKPWVTSCQEFAPVWNEFARAEPGVTMATVDCVTSPEVCREYNVHEYPTLHWYTHRVPTSLDNELQGVPKRMRANKLSLESTVAELQSITKRMQEMEKVDAAQKKYNGMVEMDDAIFSQTTDTTKTFVLYCAPSCQTLEPTWKKIAQEYSNEPVVIGNVDCVRHAELCRKQGITSFPTLRYYSANVVVEYGYDRTSALEQSLQKFVDRQLDTKANSSTETHPNMHYDYEADNDYGDDGAVTDEEGDDKVEEEPDRYDNMYASGTFSYEH